MYGGYLWIFVCLFLQTKTYKVQVTVKEGVIVGTTQATVYNRQHYYAFYGVPYAEPPIGELRFKDPLRGKKWDRPLDARTEYYSACAQGHIVHKHVYGTEDCLYINIFTPSLPKDRQSSLKAVIVWVHGFTFTSSFSHIYGPDFFIENDVIFISLTHRISVFGFLKLDDSDSHANMGLKDIVLALKWIRKNIKQFDGDKNKITVMGNDSGATFLTLILMTKFKKMFSKIILQSGGLFSPSLFQIDPRSEINKLKEKIYKATSKDLMSASAKVIIAESYKIYNNKDMINFQKPVIPFSPVVEIKSNTSLISTNPYKTGIKKNDLKIPVIIGFNSQESISQIIPFLHNPYYMKTFQSFFKYMVPFTDSCSYNYSSKTYTEIANKIKNTYFPDGISEKSVDKFARYVTDLSKYPVYKFIKTIISENKNDVYVYKFDYVGSFNVIKSNSIAGANVKIKGAAKGDELCYLFKCEPYGDNYLVMKNDTNHRDRKFINEMAEIWTNFAKSGNPTPRPYFGNITWLPMTAKTDNVLLISGTSRMIDSKVEENMYVFWNTIYEDYYSRERCSRNKHEEL